MPSRLGIRTASRAAATLLAVVIALSLRLPLANAPPEPPTIVASFIASVAPEPRPRRPIVEQPFAEATAPAEIATADASFRMPRLWTYTANGDIAFDTVEQLQRCTRARQNRSSEADCPNAFETRGMVLSEEGRGDIGR